MDGVCARAVSGLQVGRNMFTLRAAAPRNEAKVELRAPLFSCLRLQGAVQPMPQQVVAPHVGFCVKSWVESHDSHNNSEVVYLNLLFHKDVPEAVARPIVVASTHDERCATGHCSHDDSSWEIAYVLGPPRSHRAKDGTLRSVYDFIFGVKTLHRAQSDEQFRLVLVQSCYRALAEKFNITLSKKFQVVNKYAFKAPPERPKSVITEMASDATAPGPRTAVAADYAISRTQEAGILKYHIRIMLPKLDTAAGSSLALTRHAVCYSAPGKYHANIDLGAHVAIDIESGHQSVFDQISHVLHVHFQANEDETQHNRISPARHDQEQGSAPSHEPHHHSHNTPDDHFTRSITAVPPFPPQVLDLKSSSGDDTRYACFCRQTLRTITLVLAVDGGEGGGVSLLGTKVSTTGLQLQIQLSVSAGREHTLDIALFRAVKPSLVTASVSRANVVLVLEKTDPAFWPSLAPPPAARTSSALRF